MAMKCPVCGKENLEGQMFCGDCGSMISLPPPPDQPMQPVPIPTSRNWLASKWKILTAVVVVVIVALASLGLIYTQTLSKIKIIAQNISGQQASYSFLIDGTEKARGTILPGGSVIIGVWSVKAGSHTVQADCHYLGQLGPNLDGAMEYSYDCSVGPLYVKNAYVTLNPEIPDLVGDLTLYYDTLWDQVSVRGKVFNHANVPCYVTLAFSAQDTRGWNISKTVLIGQIGTNGAWREVWKDYDWPNYYGGLSNSKVIPTWTYTLTFS